MQHIIVQGSPLKGYTYTGPFADNATAIAWANNNLEGSKHWWTAPLQPAAK